MSNLKVQIWVYLNTGVLLKSEWTEHDEGITEEDIREEYSSICDPDELACITGITLTIEDGGGIFESGMEVALLRKAISAVALKFDIYKVIE
jgi:hypothetical protein